MNIQNKRNIGQDILYFVSRILLPITTMILIAIAIAGHVEIIDSVVFNFLKINVEGNKVFTIKAVKGIIIFAILWFVYNRILKKSGCIFTENVQGNYPKVIYLMAALLGYKKVSLVHKSIPLQFFLLNSRLFKDYQSNENGVTVIDVKDIEYKKEVFEGNDTTINIGIFDSYHGDKSMLPDSVKNNKTIILTPEKKDNAAKRFYSDALINSLNEILEENCKTKEYNLFSFTNPVTNRSIYENVFNTKSDNYILRAFFFDNQKKMFKDKFIGIKM